MSSADGVRRLALRGLWPLMLLLVGAGLAPRWCTARDGSDLGGASFGAGAELPPAPLGIATSETVDLPASALAGAVWTQAVHLSREMLAAVEVGRRVELPLSANEVWRGRILRMERRAPDSYSFSGTFDDSKQGWFLFTVEPGGTIAVAQVPERHVLVELRHAGGDVYAWCAFDDTKLGSIRCGVGQAVRLPAAQPGPGFEPPPVATVIPTPVPQHDIAVVYTSGLQQDFPLHYPNTDLDVAIQLLVDYANLCYANSGVALHLRLAYRGLASPTFSEFGQTRDTLLVRLMGTSDGVLDNVHSLRTTFHADIVCLMYSYDRQGLGSGGGLATVLEQPTFDAGNPAAFAPWSFCVVEGLWAPTEFVPPLGGMVMTEFAHEIGHTQGLHHNCEDASGTPVRPYAYGWRFVGNSGNRYVDVMSYMNGAYATAAPIPYFGDPAVLYDGQPTGSASPGCGYTTGARTADALDLTADFMSRLFLNPLDPWVDYAYFGAHNGRFSAPWNMLASAVNDLPVNDAAHTPTPPRVTLVGPATSSEVITISKRMVLDAAGGAVRIGGP